MSDNFYDFDKDDSFDEVYIDKEKKRNTQKEFEVNIPMPNPAKSQIKSTIPKKNEKPTGVKVSGFAKALCIIGIILTCVITFSIGFVGTIFGWNYLPNSTDQDDSVIDDAVKQDEVIEITDNGTVYVVPTYKPVAEEKPSSNEESTDESTETTNQEDDQKNPENDEDSEENNTDETASNNEGNEDEIINID